PIATTTAADPNSRTSGSSRLRRQRSHSAGSPTAASPKYSHGRSYSARWIASRSVLDRTSATNDQYGQSSTSTAAVTVAAPSTSPRARRTPRPRGGGTAHAPDPPG